MKRQFIRLEKDITPQFSIASSLREQRMAQFGFNRASRSFSTYILDDKNKAYIFASKLGVKIPQVYFKNLNLKDSLKKLSYPSVLKPVSEASGRGVFVCNSEDNILYLNSGEHFTKFTDFEKYAEDLLTERKVRTDLWMSEKLLADNNSIARDIKFYIFYGKVGLILESSRIPEIQRCWRDEKLNIVKTGKYDDLLFESTDQIPLELIELAQFVSLKTPAPFVRIDFLVSDNDYYLGEFTPAPERYWGFNDEWDEKLGWYYQDACMRLINDFSYGKRFTEYLEFLYFNQ